MSDNNRPVNRRRYLSSFGAMCTAGLAGCQGSLEVDERGKRSGCGSEDPSDESDRFAPAADSRRLRLAVGTNEKGRPVPAVQAVERGEPIEVRIVNNGTEPRSVSIEAYEINVEVEPGERTSITYAFNAPGIFPITVGSMFLNHGQLFVYPTADSTLPQVTERRLRLLVDHVSGTSSLYPPTVFALENDTVSIKIDNRTETTSAVSMEAFEVSRSIEPDVTRRFSFIPEEPGIYRINTNTAIGGQFVVLPRDTDFARIAITDRRRRRVAAETTGDKGYCIPSIIVCKQSEELILDVLESEPGDTGSEEPTKTVRITPTVPGVHPLSSFSRVERIDGQLIVLP